MSTPSPVVIVTGGSRGLGLAIIRILLERHNARVACISRSSPPELQAVVEQYGADRLLAITGDVGSEADNARLLQDTVRKWGRVDGLIFNASTELPMRKIGDLAPSEISAYTSSNLLSIFHLLIPSLPLLRASRGRVLLVSSGAATKGYQAWGLYSMVKAGMNSLARTLAAEEEANGLAVYAVRPGVIDTAMQADIRSRGPSAMDPTEHEKFIALHEKGKLVKPDIPAAVLAGLAVGGPMELSGEFIDYQDERLERYR